MYIPGCQISPAPSLWSPFLRILPGEVISVRLLLGYNFPRLVSGSPSSDPAHGNRNNFYCSGVDMRFYIWRPILSNTALLWILSEVLCYKNETYTIMFLFTKFPDIRAQRLRILNWQTWENSWASQVTQTLSTAPYTHYYAVTENWTIIWISDLVFESCPPPCYPLCWSQ